ncbi:MAG: DUF1648 domain-containing protein [Gemmatimonadota bacterium]
MRPLHWINLVLLGALLIGSALLWPTLPERVPGHFGASGEVTRWEPVSLTSWFLPLAIACSIVAMNYGVARLIPR